MLKLLKNHILIIHNHIALKNNIKTIRRELITYFSCVKKNKFRKINK